MGERWVATQPTRFFHRFVVVAVGHTFDIHAAVLARLHAAAVEHHAAGNRGFAHGVRDVEALQTLRAFGQAERFDQRA